MSLDEMRSVFINNVVSRDTIINMLDKDVAECDRVNYSNEYIKIYKQDKDKIKDTDVSEWSNILGRKPDIEDIKLFWQYKLYIQRQVQDKDIVRLINIDGNDSQYEKRGMITYTWNTVKAELTKLKYNLDFRTAIDLLIDKNSKTYKIRDDRNVTFGFQFNGVFLVVNAECIENKIIRIISYYETTEDKWKEYKAKYQEV